MAKARIIYTPEGGSKREWVINPERPPWDVMSQTEQVTGWPWEEFVTRLSQSSGLAIQALLWVLRKRTEPRLEIDGVRPSDSEGSLLDEVDFEVVDDEPVAPVKKSKKAGEGESGEA